MKKFIAGVVVGFVLSCAGVFAAPSFDHNGSYWNQLNSSAKSGYVNEEYAIKLIEAQGFRLGAKSQVNANPRDTKDYEQGVWTLPPTWRLGDKDREKFAAIGESDRFTLKFRKPLSR